MGDVTYSSLRRQVQALAKDVRKDAEAITAEAAAVDQAARDTAAVAGMIAAMKVAAATVAETEELARLMAGVSETASGYGSTADVTARAADDADRQAQTTHGGIHDAVQRSPDAAGDSGWYRQE